ncbi:MAG: TonB family protein [Bacteroidaceae bacterium]|nr:TonB family protein [Bacteroidaceae bacterium]
MSEFVIYLIKSSLLLSVGVALFMLLMKGDTFHRFNRLLLLMLTVLSLAVPALRFSVASPMARFSSMIEEIVNGADEPVSAPVVVYDWGEPIMAQVVTGNEAVTAPSLWQRVTSFDALHWVLAVYVSVALLLAVRLLYMYMRVVEILRFGKREEAALYNIKDKGIRLVVHDRRYKPFSWFGWVSISRTDIAECGNEILLHEAAHVKCGHSFDILFADLVIVLQWFNPMAWIMKSLLKDIHEYEADSAVLAAGVDAKSYQLLIIKKAVGARLYSIANSFNHSLTKKRITMMCKEKSSLWQCTKALYILPLAVVAACTFSSPQNATSDKGSEKVVNGEVSAVDSDAELVYQIVEQQPEYPGGTAELMRYLMKNIKYPAESRQRNSQGKVFVGFVIKKNGSIGDVDVVKTSGDDLLDAEAMRVVKAMPAWVPGKQGGENVNVRFTLPVIFRLQGENVPASPSMNSAVDSDNSLPEVSAVSYADENNEHAYQVVEVQPEFPGGMNALMAFMRDNMKYPDECRKNNIQGKAYVRFVVAKDGAIRDVEVVKSAGNDLLDAEAMRVVKAMPAWIPGKQDGENVNVYYTLPVVYRLQ